jgi:CRP/FNR family cyclic AMP-dependent transcriptional regulator
MLSTIIIVIGIVASVLVFLSLFMKTIMALRGFSIASNVVFITYASLQIINTGEWASISILVLHALLLPLNILRLYQVRQLIEKVKKAKYEDASLDVLIPYMKKQRFEEGEVLFRKGDRADKLYYIQSGHVELVELKKRVGPPEVIGEIGVFSPFKERTATAKCSETMEAYTIDENHIEQLYFQNPQFGYQLVQLILKRLITNYVQPSEDRCIEVGEE